MPIIQPVSLPLNTVTTITANATGVDGQTLLANCAGGNITVTVPHATGQQVTVKRIDSSTNTLTIVADSGTIDGDANATLVGIEAAATFVGDGTNVQIRSVNGTQYQNTSIAGVANTLALRDGSGRTKFVDPSAAQDAATKNYVDTRALPTSVVSAFVASLTPHARYMAYANSGSFNINLPGSPTAGDEWYISKTDNSLNAVGIVTPLGSLSWTSGAIVGNYTGGLSFPGDALHIYYDGTYYYWEYSSAAGPYLPWTPTLIQNGAALTKTVNFARYNRIGGRVHAYCQVTPTQAGSVGIITLSFPVQPANAAQPLNGQFWWLRGAHYSGFPSVFGSVGSYTVIGIGSNPSAPTTTAMGAGLPALAIVSGDTLGYSIIYEG
jgi:hypothetical protein